MGFVMPVKTTLHADLTVTAGKDNHAWFSGQGRRKTTTDIEVHRF